MVTVLRWDIMLEETINTENIDNLNNIVDGEEGKGGKRFGARSRGTVLGW